jgi:C-terminal processing protease CtpA/Prc
LQEICATLKDGHTNIYFPTELIMEIAKPPLEFRWVDKNIYITNADKSLEGMVTLGSSLMSVDGIPVNEYLERKIFPFVSSSTEHIKRSISCSRILEGDINKGVSIVVMTPTGELKEMELERSHGSINWIRSSPPRKILEYKRLKDSISYVSLNRFNTNKIVSEFITYVDSIKNTSYLILDLRMNGGGNSSNGYEILKYFAEKPFITSKWGTREHKAAYKAWGSSINKMKNELSEWEREAKLTFEDDYWHIAAPDTIQANSNDYIDIPCVILVGNETASAAEDFLVAAESIPFGVTIGDYTYGSTGQPLHLRLPGGGSARICTKRDTYPDGREFVGYGVIPDYVVKESLEDILNNRDVVLDFALDYFDR